MVGASKRAELAARTAHDDLKPAHQLRGAGCSYLDSGVCRVSSSSYDPSGPFRRNWFVVLIGHTRGKQELVLWLAVRGTSGFEALRLLAKKFSLRSSGSCIFQV